MSFVDYVAHGWRLTPIEPGQKGPTHAGWNNPDQVVTHPLAAQRLNAAGLCHAYSGTCAIDIDDYDKARTWFAAREIDLDALFTAPDAVRIQSPKGNRGKLIYRLPTPMPTKKILDGKATVLEFRCATAAGLTMQDVLPPSPYPAGGRYQWVGDWRSLPELPAALRDIWASLIVSQAPAGTTEPTVDKAELAALLADLDPAGMPYDDWLQVGMALHHEYAGSAEGLQAWLEWSKRDTARFKGEADLAPRWQGFTAGGGITGQSLRAKQDADIDAMPVVTGPPPGVPSQAEPLIELDLSDLPTAVPPPRLFVVDKYIPRGYVTLLAGHGGSGKSYLSLAISACVATGEPFGQIPCEQGRVLVVSLEDSGDVVKPRLRRTAEAAGLDLETVMQNVTILTAGANDAALVTEQDRQLVVLPALKQLVHKAAGYDLVIIDNASDAFNANENDRRLVRKFVRGYLQQHIAMRHDCGVLLIAHVDKAGVRHGTNGESYSGSTAWNNSVRSRLALLDDEGTLKLYHEKFNLTEQVEPLALDRGAYGVLRPLTEIELQARADADIWAVVEAIKAATVDVYVATRGQNTSWGVLQSLLPADWNKKRCDAALDRAEREKYIEREEFSTASRNRSQRWAVCLEKLAKKPLTPPDDGCNLIDLIGVPSE